MREHIRIIGVLNIVMGCLTALVGVVVLMITGGVAGVIASGNGVDPRAASVLALIGVGIAIFFLVLALPSIVGGWGLLKFKRWARTLMIVVSIFHLFHIPLGTALGVYGLWALFSDEGRQLLGSGPAVAVPSSMPYPSNSAHVTYPPQPPPGF